MRRWGAIAVCVVLGCGSHAAAPTPPPVINAPPDAGVGVVAPVTMTCTAGADRAEFNPYDEARQLEGDDGAHTDACDAHGNLLSYQCEAESFRCPGGGGRDRRPVRPCYRQTGRVEEEQVDCDGGCAAGACNQRCPAFGDTLVYLSVGATVVFDSNGDARHIECTLGYDQQDDYDCANDPRPGDTLTVEGLGLSSTMCTGGVWGALSDRRCTYTGCRYVR